MGRVKFQLLFLKQTFRLKGGLEKNAVLLADACAASGISTAIITESVDEKGVGYSGRGWAWVSVSLPCSLFSVLRMIFFDRAVRAFIKNRCDTRPLLFGFDRHFLRLDFYRAGNGCHKAYLERRYRESHFFKRCALYCNPLHWATLWAERKTYLNPATQIICNSHMVRDEIVRCYPKICEKRISVIHNGVDWGSLETDFLKGLEYRSEKRAAFSVPDGAFHIILLGNEWYRKGVDILLRAAKLLILKNIPIFVTVAGRERRPEAFKKIVSTLSIESHVQLIPKSISAIELFQSADICAIPSRYDPFANVTVEAQAMGLWVVTSTENGGAEIIQSPASGYVCSQLCEKELADGILLGIESLSQDAPTYQAFRKAIRESAKKNDLKKCLSLYLELIKNKI